jgi:hypothetical protein
MFATIVSLGGGGGSSAAGKTPDEIVYELCESYLKSIPKPLNLEDVMVKYPTDYNECMNTVSCRTAGVRPVLNLGPDCLSARRSWRRR